MAESLESYSDISDSESDPLTDLFNKAAEHVKTLVANLQPPKLLEIYSYYKQSTAGPCNTPRPKWYEMQAKAKWDAWNQLRDMSSENAKKYYIKIISELDPDFDPTEKSASWVTVSSCLNTDEILKESDKTVFDFVKEGDLDKLILLVKNNTNLNNLKDEEGLSLLHWASDRGNLDILKFLIQSNANVNLKDNEGQTALHYAASCDHLSCVQFLIENGAEINSEDSDGMKPKDLASDAKIVELLNKVE